MVSPAATPQQVAGGSSAAAPPTGRTAARRVYDLLEIRQIIIRLLDKSVLAKLLLVDKQGMGLVVQELYKEMGYNNANAIASVDESRLQLYCNAVKVIDAYTGTLKLLPHMREAFGFDEADPDVPEDDAEEDEREWNNECWTKEYHPEMVDLLIPPLRDRFPALRRVEFGEVYSPLAADFWFVQLPTLEPATPLGDPLTPQSPPVASSLPQPLGHIQHYTSRLFDIDIDLPPPSLDPPPFPAAKYTQNELVDLTIYTANTSFGQPYPDNFAPWVVALRSAEWLGSLYKGINTGPLPLNLADFTHMYSRQDASGSGARLVDIETRNILPFDMRDFTLFATAASSSLTNLVLCSYQDDEHYEAESKICFSNLPELFSIIRANLPNLSRLMFAADDIEAAERKCRGSLRPDSLEQRGSIWTLKIFTSKPPSFPFNTLRLVSTVCQVDPTIWVGTRKGILQPQDLREASNYIPHLRSHNPLRRQHLSTVDFAELDIQTPAQVIELKYAKDGRPLRRGVQMSREWRNTAQAAEQKATRDLLPSLAQHLTRLASSSARLHDRTRLSDTSVILDEVRQMLDAAGEVADAAARVQRIVEDAKALAAGLEEYALALEDVKFGGR